MSIVARLDWIVQTSGVQTMTLTYRSDGLIYLYECTSIHRPLYHPLRYHLFVTNSKVKLTTDAQQ